MKNPKISVIVPAYKTAKYIPECLDSVLAQTFTDFEIICINDGSPDNSLDIFNEYAARDIRVRVINQKNQGVVFARNNAIKAARGKYIFCLDSDDIIAETCLGKLYSIIILGEFSVVCPGYKSFGTENKDFKLRGPTKLNMYTFHNTIHNSSLFPKSLWEKYGGYCRELNSLMLEDYDFWLCFLDDGKKITAIPDKLFFYRKIAVSRSMANKDVIKKTKKIIKSRHPKIYFYTLLRLIIRPFLKR